MDHFRCVDMRTVSFDVPPQEVIYSFLTVVLGPDDTSYIFLADPVPRLGYCDGRCRGIFQCDYS